MPRKPQKARRSPRTIKGRQAVTGIKPGPENGTQGHRRAVSSR